MRIIRIIIIKVRKIRIKIITKIGGEEIRISWRRKSRG